MNCLIKLFILFLNVLILSACNDAITRFLESYWMGAVSKGEQSTRGMHR